MDKEVLALVLKYTKDNSVLDFNELEGEVNRKKLSSFLTELQNTGLIFQPTLDGNYTLTREQRAAIVLYGAQNGLDFEPIIKHLTWQEFELLTTMIGDEFGYFATTGLNFSTNERKYQIDVVLKNKPYIFLIDCKHFGGTGKKSILQNAALEQIERTKAVVQEINKLKAKLNIRKWHEGIFIPLIITWLDDSVFFHETVPVVPFSKLRSFFRNFYVYLEDIFKLKINIEE
ncbi:MAG: NERD domain-containing protein [Candidatus Thorarchaeota archaeon]